MTLKKYFVDKGLKISATQKGFDFSYEQTSFHMQEYAKIKSAEDNKELLYCIEDLIKVFNNPAVQFATSYSINATIDGQFINDTIITAKNILERYKTPPPITLNQDVKKDKIFGKYIVGEPGYLIQNKIYPLLNKEGDFYLLNIENELPLLVTKSNFEIVKGKVVKCKTNRFNNITPNNYYLVVNENFADITIIDDKGNQADYYKYFFSEA